MSWDDENQGCEAWDPYDGDDLAALRDRELDEDEAADRLANAADYDTLHATLRIPAEELAWANGLLAADHPAEKYGSDAVIHTWTVAFPDGLEVDLKLCNGDTPWLDCVLFEDGNEVEVGEPTDGPVEGDYCFSGYTLHVEAA